MKINPQKILLIATRRLGDVLLVTPLLHSLRKAYPDAQIDLLVYKHTAIILQGNTDYNELITVSEHPKLDEYKKLFKRIFRRYDLSISTLAGDRPLIYTILSGRKRIAIVPPKRWQDSWKRWLVNAWTELDDKNTHTVIQYLRLADLLEIKRHYKIINPQLSNASAKLNGLLPFDWQKENYAVLHLAPMWNYKRWSDKGWQELSHYLKETGLHIVLTGGTGEEENAYIKTIQKDMPEGVINLSAKLSFSDVTELIKNSRIYIGPDTAVTHLAAATGTATIALFGPTNPLKWAPWPYQYELDQTPFSFKGSKRVNNVVLLQGEGDCVPCHQEGCDRHRQSSSQCLQMLNSGRVIDWVKRLLSDT